MGLALALLLFIIIAGPTVTMLTGFFGTRGAYLQYLPALSNPIGREDANFSQGWTAFYWAQWISWSPFVGMFIARVSRGHTVLLGIIPVVFFITSSDSGSRVINTITAGGKVNSPVPQGVFCCTSEGVIALLLGGGLMALQAMTVSTGLPFTIVLLVGCISIVKGLMSEPR